MKYKSILEEKHIIASHENIVRDDNIEINKVAIYYLVKSVFSI